MIPAVKAKKAKTAELCERYGVEWLDLFGSAANDSFAPDESDLDFVVSFERRDL